ncbi:MAG: hypothetical protein LBF65_01105 [Holosporales bacterium]|jgi:hypothetical protein|nr:hypothetical protein [Holosporales bacterium]
MKQRNKAVVFKLKNALAVSIAAGIFQFNTVHAMKLGGHPSYKELLYPTDPRDPLSFIARLPSAYLSGITNVMNRGGYVPELENPERENNYLLNLIYHWTQISQAIERGIGCMHLNCTGILKSLQTFDNFATHTIKRPEQREKFEKLCWNLSRGEPVNKTVITELSDFLISLEYLETDEYSSKTAADELNAAMTHPLINAIITGKLGTYLLATFPHLNRPGPTVVLTLVQHFPSIVAEAASLLPALNLQETLDIYSRCKINIQLDQRNPTDWRLIPSLDPLEYPTSIMQFIKPWVTYWQIVNGDPLLQEPQTSRTIMNFGEFLNWITSDFRRRNDNTTAYAAFLTAVRDFRPERGEKQKQNSIKKPFSNLLTQLYDYLYVEGRSAKTAELLRQADRLELFPGMVTDPSSQRRIVEIDPFYASTDEAHPLRGLASKVLQNAPISPQLLVQMLLALRKFALWPEREKMLMKLYPAIQMRQHSCGEELVLRIMKVTSQELEGPQLRFETGQTWLAQSKRNHYDNPVPGIKLPPLTRKNMTHLCKYYKIHQLPTGDGIETNTFLQTFFQLNLTQLTQATAAQVIQATAAQGIQANVTPLTGALFQVSAQISDGNAVALTFDILRRIAQWHMPPEHPPYTLLGARIFAPPGTTAPLLSFLEAVNNGRLTEMDLPFLQALGAYFRKNVTQYRTVCSSPDMELEQIILASRNVAPTTIPLVPDLVRGAPDEWRARMDELIPRLEARPDNPLARFAVQVVRTVGERLEHEPIRSWIYTSERYKGQFPAEQMDDVLQLVLSAHNPERSDEISSRILYAMENVPPESNYYSDLGVNQDVLLRYKDLVTSPIRPEGIGISALVRYK